MLAMFSVGALLPSTVALLGLTFEVLPMPALQLAGAPVFVGLTVAFVVSNMVLQSGDRRCNRQIESICLERGGLTGRARAAESRSRRNGIENEFKLFAFRSFGNGEHAHPAFRNVPYPLEVGRRHAAANRPGRQDGLQASHGWGPESFPEVLLQRRQPTHGANEGASGGYQDPVSADGLTDEALGGDQRVV